MNRYDDLQRFKDKTRTQSLEFKDFSSQSSSHDRGDWSILNQLSPSPDPQNGLAAGGSVSQIVPQPVDADLFASHADAPAPAVVKETPQTSAPTIMNSIPAPATTVVEPQPAAPPVIDTPVPQAARPAAPATAVNYSRLFATAATGEATRPDKNKDQPLKSLLERIASCR